MPKISSLSVSQLERAVAIKKQIEKLQAELDTLDGQGGEEAVEVVSYASSRKRRGFSAATKAKMAAAQKARWEKRRAQKTA